MKKIIFIALLFLAIRSEAQTGYTTINSRYNWLAGIFKALGLPAGSGPAAFTSGQAQIAGAIYYDSTGIDSGLYVWSGLAWRSYEPYTDADARSAISLTTNGSSGPGTYDELTGVFNIPDYSTTASEGITKTGSDFTWGGTISSNRVLTVNNGSFSVNKSKNVAADYLFLALDTVSNPDLDANIPFAGFLAKRTLRFPSYASTTYRQGSQIAFNIQIKDSALLNTFGGDFQAANKTTMVLEKMSGYSGRSVFMGGSGGFSEGVAVQLNDLTLQHSTSTTSNYRYAKNYWIGTRSYLIMGQNDTLENWVGFHNMGFNQGNHQINYAFDFVGGHFGDQSATRVINPWGVYIHSMRSKNLFAGPTGFGDSTIEASALIDASSTTKGVIWPRMTTTQKNAIASPATGLIVFDTDLINYYYYNGSAWAVMGGSSTPTLQQVLTAGSTLTGTNAVETGQFPFSIRGQTGGDGTGLYIDDPNNTVSIRDNGSTGFYVSGIPGSVKGKISGTDFFSFDQNTSQHSIGQISATIPHVIIDEPSDIIQLNSASLRMQELVAPTTPDLGFGYMYEKTDGKLYFKNDGGTEYDLTATGGSGTVNSGTQYRLGYYATTGTAISEAAAITGNRVLISDVNGVPTHSVTTATEIGYVNGVTSLIQTQIDGKIGGSLTSTRIPFATAATTLSDDASMTWDNTNKRLSVGNNTATNVLTINGGDNSTTTSTLRLQSSGTTKLNISAGTSTTDFYAVNHSLRFYVDGNGNLSFRVAGSTGITYNAEHATTGKHTFQTNTVTRAIIDNNGLNLGVAGTTLGVLKFNGNTSGTATVQSAAAAGTPIFTLGTTTGTIAGALTATAALDFASTASQTSTDLTITVTGAADGDEVSIGVPNAATNANSCFTAWVSAANTITVRFNNYSSGAIDPASGTFRATVVKY